MLVPVMISIVILMLLIIIVKLEKREVTKSATVDKLEPKEMASTTNGYIKNESHKDIKKKNRKELNYKECFDASNCEKEEAQDHTEAEHNPEVKEKPKQMNPKHEHTEEQLNILIKLAGKELTDEQDKINYSKSTNT